MGIMSVYHPGPKGRFYDKRKTWWDFLLLLWSSLLGGNIIRFVFFLSHVSINQSIMWICLRPVNYLSKSHSHHTVSTMIYVFVFVCVCVYAPSSYYYWLLYWPQKSCEVIHKVKMIQRLSLRFYYDIIAHHQCIFLNLLKHLWLKL